MATYYGRNRSTSYLLGNKLGRGGEGEVYEIAGKGDLVAKIYFSQKFSSASTSSDPRQILREKIETMLDQPVDPYINGVLSVAWPQDILFDQQGQFVGYTMPRVNSKYHLFHACRERERVQLFPKYSWKTSIMVAYNLALAVKMVHKTNAVVGDLNPNNIMLNEKGHVTLIDTDSFNITNRKTGKVYKCSVGVAEVLPAELQGRDLSKPTSVFTKQTDNFAVAIHIFNLLMNNCHPFGCVGLNNPQSSSTSNPVVRNIVKGRCPYVTGGTGDTSPFAPDIMMLPKEIRQLFDRAFDYTAADAVKPETIARRPSAQEWQNALGALYQSNMSECRKAAPNVHVYPAGYGKCPWCAMNHQTPPPPPPPLPANRNTRASRTNQTVPSHGANNTVPAGNMGNRIRRESWPLWLTCILMGVITGPLMAQFLVPLCYEAFDFILSYEAAYTILAILGGIIGAVIAHYGQESYQKAYNGWPWLLLGLLVPVGTILAVAALMLVAFIVIGVVTVVLYVIGAAIAVACVCGMCSGG